MIVTGLWETKTLIATYNQQPVRFEEDCPRLEINIVKSTETSLGKITMFGNKVDKNMYSVSYVPWCEYDGSVYAIGNITEMDSWWDAWMFSEMEMYKEHCQ